MVAITETSQVYAWGSFRYVNGRFCWKFGIESSNWSAQI